MSGLRPRRTRVYDCNYNAGEQYYKSALDGLDRKYNTKPSVLDRLTAKSYERNLNMDDELASARRRAGKVIKDDSVFDSRGGKLSKSICKLENEFDEQVNPAMSGSLARIRASKKMATMFDDLDLADEISSVKRKTRIDLGEKLDDDLFSSSIRKRGIKMIHRGEEDRSTGALTKWSAIEDTPRTTGASQRALASQARINDIESEMFERSEKQAARDKRSAHLKKFMADECDTDNTTSKSIRISSRSEKKMISF